MTEHQNFEANEFFKVVGDPPRPPDPDDTVARMKACFAAAEAFERASNAAGRCGDEDDCRIIAALSETIDEQLAVFHSLIRNRIARPWQPDPEAAEAAELDALIAELREQHTAAAGAAEHLDILIAYLSGGEELNAGDLEYAALVGPFARSLPDYIANLGYKFQSPGRRLAELAAAPSIATLETRIASRNDT